jgi:drug/metabolite transporter (DMT)-like permease
MAGAAWALIAAIAFSLGHVALAQGLRALGVARGTTILLWASAATVALLAVPIEGASRLVESTAGGLLFFAAAGLIHYGSWGFMNASIRLVGPSRMAAITGVTPLFAAILAVVTLGESVNLLVGVGIALIVAGTYLIARS